MRLEKFLGVIQALLCTLSLAVSCDHPQSRQASLSKDDGKGGGGNPSNTNPSSASTDKNSSAGPETVQNPVNITGVYLASYDNSRVRCDYTQQTVGSYTSLCTVVVAQTDGSELKAQKLQQGVTLNWLDPQKVTGTADITGCQPSKDTLSFTCNVATSASARAVQLLFGLKIADPTRGEKTESASLMLPYAVGVTAGFAPSVPFQYTGQTTLDLTADTNGSPLPLPQKVGFQQTSYLAGSLDMSQPDAYCTREGRLFFVHGSFIYQLQNGMVTLYAGSSMPGNAMNTSNRLRTAIWPSDILCAGDAIYVTSMYFCRILKITDDGPVEIVTGKEQSCASTADGQPAKDAAQPPISMLAMAPSGELVFSEITGKIRKITSAGTLATIADLGEGESATDPNWSSNTTPNFISGLAVDSAGNVYAADTPAQYVYKITKDGTVSKVAGTGIVRYKNATNPKALADPSRLMFDKSGALLIGEAFRGIKKLGADGSLSTVISAGDDLQFELLRQPDMIRKVSLERPNFTGIVMQADGGLVTGGPRGVMRYDTPAAQPHYIVGNSPVTLPCELPIAANLHHLLSPTSMAYTKTGSLLIPDFRALDSDQIVIWSISQFGETTFRRGLYGCDNNALLKSRNNTVVGIVNFNDIGGIAAAPDGSLFFANAQRHLILKIAPTGTITTIAGNGTAASTGDGGSAAAAEVRYPVSGAAGPDGSFYFVEAGWDNLTSRVRKISAAGIITTVAGSGPSGDDGEGGPATSAKLKAAAIALDTKGRLFIADQGNGKIKMVDEKGLIHTIAGGGKQFFANGPIDALSAQLAGPTSLAFANDGTIYMVDNGLGVAELRPQSGDKWDISVLFGMPQGGDCGTGKMSGTATMQTNNEAIKNSLAIICAGSVRNVVVSDSCPGKDGQTRIAFSQTFDDYANVVEVTKPCATP